MEEPGNPFSTKKAPALLVMLPYLLLTPTWYWLLAAKDCKDPIFLLAMASINQWTAAKHGNTWDLVMDNRLGMSSSTLPTITEFLLPCWAIPTVPIQKEVFIVRSMAVIIGSAYSISMRTRVPHKLASTPMIQTSYMLISGQAGKGPGRMVPGMGLKADFSNQQTAVKHGRS